MQLTLPRALLYIKKTDKQQMLEWNNHIPGDKSEGERDEWRGRGE